MKLILYKAILLVMGAAIPMTMINPQTQHALALTASYMGLCLICGALFVCAALLLRDKSKDPDDYDDWSNEQQV